ncbi:MAG: carboxypeptidase-like regulatory domain-containing protein [Candidatus Baltobacteraceae bacterium]
MKIVCVVALCMLLAPGSRAMADGNTGMVRGHVNDQKNQPVEGASVTLNIDGEEITTTTGLDGFFVFLSVRPGLTYVTPEKMGYSWTCLPLYRVFANQTRDVGTIMLSNNPVDRETLGPRCEASLHSLLPNPGETADVYDIF